MNTWLITGVAGFIGSHLARTLLKRGECVRGLDNLSSGHQSNIASMMDHPNFSFIHGDIIDLDTCIRACTDVDYILHHAAIGSVIKSIQDPAFVDKVNNGGFINILIAAQKCRVNRVVYATSSAVYGHEKSVVNRHEDEPTDPLSPYAASKCANEMYARSFTDVETFGLRYFNIYGPRQDPNGAYAAVIPRWIDAMIKDEPIEIYGDGETLRDFCAVEDVVLANIAAAQCNVSESVCNIGSGHGVTLNELFTELKDITGYSLDPVYKDFREGDIKRSSANISKAEHILGFKPTISLHDGLNSTVRWYKNA